MVRKWDTGKKILFCIVFVLAFLRIVFIAIGGEIDREYYISTDIDISNAVERECINATQTFMSNQSHLKNLMLIFSGIAEDKQGEIVLKIAKAENIIYQAKITLADISNYEWTTVYINMPLEKGVEYRIEMTASDACTQIPNVLISEGTTESVSSSINNAEIDGQIAINYGYMRFPERNDRIISSSLWLIFLFLFTMVLNYMDIIKDCGRKIYALICARVNEDIFLVIFELMLCMIIINCSKVPFQEPTKIILYLISLVCAYKARYRINVISLEMNKAWKRVMHYILYIYAAFALVGQRLLIYPFTLKISIGGLIVFFATYLWFIPIVDSIIYGFEILGQLMIDTKIKRMNNIKLLLILFLLLILPAAYNLYANNPGISSWDTYATMLGNAHHLHGMFDWHPVFYCIVLRVILSVWNSTYAVILVQYFFWLYVMLEILLYLRKKGMKDGIIISVALFSGFNACNFLYINTIWKDIPYTLSLLWTMILLIKLLLDFEEYRKKWYIYFELIVALVGVCLYRKNGIVSFGLIAMMMIIILRKSIKVWCTLAITVVAILIVKFPIYSYLEIENAGRYGMYIGLGQDILGVYYADGEVSEETMQMINVMTNYNNAEYEYSSTWSRQSYDLDVEPKEFIINYLDTFIKNPVTMIRVIINREDAVWDILMGQDVTLGCIDYKGTVNDVSDVSHEWNEYYPVRTYNILYTGMAAWTQYTADNQCISAIEWRCGLFTLLSLIAVFTAIIKGKVKQAILITSPIIGQVMSLLLSTGWSDFRYFWPLNLMNMTVTLFTFILLKNEELR